MTFWTSHAVAEALELSQRPDVDTFSAVETDTRLLRRGALFVALAGERFDGHAFLEQARDRGGAAAVVRRGTPPIPRLQLLEVDDPLRAYGRLARLRRRSIKGPVVAITGTNGKTSTKEFVTALMRTAWQTHATRLNNNNRVGVPLTILEAPDSTECLVIEAGANEPGEISDLREIIEPDIGVVTNVSAGHLKGFGSLQGVMREKVSLLEGVAAAVVGERPAELAERARQVATRVLTAGLSGHADVSPERWRLDERGFGSVVFGESDVRLAVPGVHQVANATISMAVALLAGLPWDAAAAMASVTLPHGRCEVIERESLTIIDDTYNANPASLKAALELAQTLRKDRPLVVVVGTMLELGNDTVPLHRAAVREILNVEPDLVGAVGAFVPELEGINGFPGDRLILAADVEELGRGLRARLRGGELVLLKASRGVGLERAIPLLTES